MHNIKHLYYFDKNCVGKYMKLEKRIFEILPPKKNHFSLKLIKIYKN